MKKYKDCSPVDTITKVRKILYDLDLFVKEIPYNNSKHFHACKIVLNNKRLDGLNFAANGKGMTYEYALASGYAEFMERLQNGLIFNGLHFMTKEFVLSLNKSGGYEKKIENNGGVLDFVYDPNEKNISLENSVDDNFIFYSDLFPFLNNDRDAIVDFLKNELNFEELVSVPFYSKKENLLLYLPIEIIFAACGSNGMASGNTKNEALIQGFCEIFERYAGYKIYYENIVPPTIPLDYFKNKEIYSTIVDFLQETNYKLIIKDCSLGLGLPVIGIMVIDSVNGKYNFNLGSSLNPDIALERCLTEIYQNPIGIYWNEIRMEKYSDISQHSEDFEYINGNNIFTNGTGYWPINLFENRVSYEFESLNYCLNYSDFDDICFVESIIKNMGYNIYIRDVSFLGFNSYYIVVPGMSQYPVKRSHYHILGNAWNALSKLKNIKILDSNCLSDLCSVLNVEYSNIKHSGIKFQDLFVCISNYDLHDLDYELLLFMMNYKIGNLNFCLFYITEFLKNKSFKSYSYYFGIRDYILLLIQNKSKIEILNILKNLYNEYEEICQDMNDPDEIFKYHEWSSCFDCNVCDLKKDCRHFDVLSVIKSIHKKQKENIIDYSGFFKC